MTSDYIRWAEGYGRILHTEETCRRVQGLSDRFDREMVLRVLAAADRLASAGMWTVAHMTYARRVDLSGAPLPIEAFKAKPQGHTGGALNVVPAYVGYLAANLITAQTRGWLLGQGHCAAAIEAVNALTGNLSPAQEGRYGPDEAGLSRLCADFYSSELDAAGRPQVYDTTDANGIARMTGLSSGEYWIHARYDLPFEELYWNVPVTVGGEPVQVQLTRQTAQVRPKL